MRQGPKIEKIVRDLVSEAGRDPKPAPRVAEPEPISLEEIWERVHGERRQPLA